MKTDGTETPRKGDGSGAVKQVKVRREVVWTPLRIRVFATLLVVNAVAGWFLVGVGVQMGDGGAGEAMSMIGFTMLAFVHCFLVIAFAGEAMTAGFLGIAVGFTLAGTGYSAAVDTVRLLSGEDVDLTGGGVAACVAFLALIPTIILSARERTATRKQAEARAREHDAQEQS
ncbi:hypothetical protein ABGB12_33620 [Actinocorallia sp. B10E7]|uniref:hypothetical protein n=1 Tax=Actinocorallia sp. B10E7 TaxID=3153558 RepID=UPI00325EFECA